MRIRVEEADSGSPAINRNALKATRRQKVVILGPDLAVLPRPWDCGMRTSM